MIQVILLSLLISWRSFVLTATGDTCQTNDHCEPGETCVRGGICGKCNSNVDCREKLVCLVSTHQNGETNGKCTNCRENQDCGDELSCLASELCGVCSSADPCQDGQKCLEGDGGRQCFKKVHPKVCNHGEGPSQSRT